MPDSKEIENWAKVISEKYRNYLTTSFYFKDEGLRDSFEDALNERGKDGGRLCKGPFSEYANSFELGQSARELADGYFLENPKDLYPALLNSQLYKHQEQAIRQTHGGNNIVVATGTASGKTESFLYPILFHLYQQYLDGALNDGVQALILYPMNALANDQRQRLGKICEDLQKSGSGFKPTFGQYIGSTPEDANDKYRKPAWHEKNAYTNEKIYRKEMRKSPPHILLTNYSMLEYLLIRPNDSELFDNGRSTDWKFLVLDEAHQYRGAKGMEMGMLVRRLKQRLREGGRKKPFCCIATSATISSEQGKSAQNDVANFAKELFDESFHPDGVIFGVPKLGEAEVPRRFHFFVRALEGAFLVHKDGKDEIILNRKFPKEAGGANLPKPLEIALCKECGQHYYVGCRVDGFLREAWRDPGGEVKVDFYMPDEKNGDMFLCRVCGEISRGSIACGCEAAIRVKHCKKEKDETNPEQLKKCAACGYTPRRRGDPVQEIVRGADGPNSVIATALHQLMSAREDANGSKILTFADSRQEAAFFAWYAEDTYKHIHARNFIYRAVKSYNTFISLDVLYRDLLGIMEKAGIFSEFDHEIMKTREIWGMLFQELLTEERRISLSGVGLIEWSSFIPPSLDLNAIKCHFPVKLNDDETRRLLGFLFDFLRQQRAVEFLGGINKQDAIPPNRSQRSACIGKPQGRGSKVIGKPQKRDPKIFSLETSDTVKSFFARLCEKTPDCKEVPDGKFWDAFYQAIEDHDRNGGEEIFIFDKDTYRLNPRIFRVRALSEEDRDIKECDKCARITTFDIRGICPRPDCKGTLRPANMENLSRNHYRALYQSLNMPPKFSAEEHTAQVESQAAWKRQDDFKKGKINLLSTSTTFEVGVDLGDLETVFLRNVPPEPFNYTQRTGRAGRREDKPGFALTYCRRNPHDLYHYIDPEERILQGKVNPPRLRMQNEKIIQRHITAVVLSEFFRKQGGAERFNYFCNFIGCPKDPGEEWRECQNCESWESPKAAADLRVFCEQHKAGIAQMLEKIVPVDMHKKLNLGAGANWIGDICDGESRLAQAEAEQCLDFCQLRNRYKQLIAEKDWEQVKLAEEKLKTMVKEKTLEFLSRKAVIPKYGFPVDVVELDVGMSCSPKARDISLQRDLSQAIAEYAPGSVIIANKKEWKSVGYKRDDRAPIIRGYNYDKTNRRFKQWVDDPSREGGRYLLPKFGFATQFGKEPKNLSSRPRRLYTTRPFFVEDESTTPKFLKKFGIEITEANPGRMVVLCEGKNKNLFYLCQICGVGNATGPEEHKTSYGLPCDGEQENLALGHEFETDVVHIRIPRKLGEEVTEVEAYSLAYAILLGAARELNVSDNDLNVTVAGDAIVLYDNVPGGAGLVASLTDEKTLRNALINAKERVNGECGCDASCYGCLRSYRNQFVHTILSRKIAYEILSEILERKDD